MSTKRVPPIMKPAKSPASDPAHGAAFIFLHGLGDEAAGCENIADQFQAANKLSHMQWVFPNALENRDALDTAWYTPTSLAAPPAGRPELADDEDEDGLRESVTYVETLLDDLTSKGVPADRIVLGGFSQGCAMSLLTGLTSKYADRLAGIVGLMGYLPIPNRIQAIRAENELPSSIGEMPVFLAKGGADRLIPRSKWAESLTKLSELGLNEAATEVHEYDGLGHSLSPTLLGDMDKWLAKVVPSME